MQGSKHQAKEGMAEATMAMEVDGLGPVASDGEEALEAVTAPVEVETEGLVVEVQEEVDPVAVEAEGTLRQVQQDQDIILTLKLRSFESNPT